MKRKLRAIRSGIVGLCAVVVFVVAGGLGGTGTASGTSGAPKSASVKSGVDQSARRLVPASIRASGVLRFATELQWPPFDFANANGQPAGIEVDLVRAIGRRLGLTTTVSDVAFSSIIPSVVNGRYDIGGNQLNDTAARRKVVQFVDYYRAEHSLLVSKNPPAEISVSNLCGYSLAQNQGSPEVDLVMQMSKQCVARGKKPIAITQLTGSAAAVLAVGNHRVDGYLLEPAVGRYLAEHSTEVKMLPGVVPASAGTYAKATTGLVIAKNNGALASAVKAALQSLMDNGSYKSILRKWGVTAAALPKATINLGGPR